MTRTKKSKTRKKLEWTNIILVLLFISSGSYIFFYEKSIQNEAATCAPESEMLVEESCPPEKITSKSIVETVSLKNNNKKELYKADENRSVKTCAPKSLKTIKNKCIPNPNQNANYNELSKNKFLSIPIVQSEKKEKKIGSSKKNRQGAKKGSKKSRKENFIAFKKFQKENEPNIQRFKFDGRKDTLLITKNKVVIMIPKNAFKTAKGDKVELKVQEYFDNNEITVKGLNTTNFNNVLETAGMFFVEASVKGKNIKLAKNKRLIFNVPGSMCERNRPYDIFYGQVKRDNLKRTQLNWMLDKNAKSDFNFKMESTFGFYDINMDKKFLNADSWLNVKNEIISFQNEIKNLAQYDKTAKVIINYYPENEFSDVKIINLNNSLLHKKVTKVITNAVNKMKETDNLSSEFGNEFASFSCSKSKPFSIKKYKSVLKEAEYSEDCYEKFYVSNLNWINVDRLSKYSNKKNLLVNVDESFVGEIVLKIKEARSFLKAKQTSNSKYTFYDVPQNLETVIVAMKAKDDEIYLQTKEFFTKRTDRTAVAMMDFIPFSQDSLNAALQDPPRDCACLARQ